MPIISLAIWNTYINKWRHDTQEHRVPHTGDQSVNAARVWGNTRSDDWYLQVGSAERSGLA